MTERNDRTNGWTGGQYSLFRAIFGIWLSARFATSLVSRDTFTAPLLHWPAPGGIVLAVATLLALLFAVGFADRIAAAGLIVTLAFLMGPRPFAPGLGLAFTAGILLAHLFLPPAPYGSWAARGRSDPSGGWRMPGPIFAAAWILLALGYALDGWIKLADPSWRARNALAGILESPVARHGLLRDLFLAAPDGLQQGMTYAVLALEIAFAPLALSRRLRPVLWSALLAMQLTRLFGLDAGDLGLARVMLHLFAFDPAWVPPGRATETEAIYYDGHCGLCHRAVRFVLAEDRAGDAFRFAPLGGNAFRVAVPEDARAGLPDSIVVQRADGGLLARSAAVLYIGARLGGAWRTLAAVTWIVPRPLRDLAYDGVARVRYRLFGRPAEVCPIIPPELRGRFDA
jgi:predicted DCC family thiol-disulfide oxidoreductase YuxK